jgi:excisionase family DNA binding protein
MRSEWRTQVEPKAFYSPREVAEVLDLHEVTVLRLLREGEIPAGKVGRQWRVSHAALEEMLGQRIAAGKHPLAQPSPAPTPAPAAPAEPSWSPRPEATPGGILDLVQALRRTVDQAPARHRTADDLRHLRTAERILAALQEDLDTDDDGGPNAAVRRLQEVAGALQHADHLLDAATEALPENIREEFAGDLLLVMDRTRQALEDLERLERAVRNRL